MRDGKRGQVIIVFVLCLFVLLGFAALAIDVGYLFSVRGELQRSADAGALAGAYVFHDGAWEKDDIPKELKKKADEKARTIASRDPVVDKPLNADPKNGEILVDFEKGAVNQIQVKTKRKVDLFFAGILGIPAVTIEATAKAAAEPVDREVMCLAPLAIPYKKDLKQGDEVDFKVAYPKKSVKEEASDKIIFALQSCGDSSLSGFYSRIVDPCMDKGACRFKVGDLAEVMPAGSLLFFPTNLYALSGMYQLAFNITKGDPASQWDKLVKDLPGSPKFGEDTWMYSPRVMRVILYDFEKTKNTGTIEVEGFAAIWIGWKEGDSDNILKEILEKVIPMKLDEVKVKGRYLSANAVGDTSNPSAWPPDLKIPSLKTTRLVQ